MRILLVILFCGLIQGVSFGQNFELTGLMKLESSVATNNFNFFVRVAGSRWFFRTEPVETNSTPISNYQDSYDGTYVYYYREFKSISLTGQKKRPANSSSATIESNNIPCEKSSFAPPIWLAFCSASYFESTTGNKMMQLFDTGYPRFENRLFPYTRQLHENFPHLPTQIEFYSDGYAISEDKVGNLQLTRMRQPYDKGWKSEVFKAMNFTNFSGAWIPMEFSLECFLPQGGQNATSNTVERVTLWTGRVNSITFGTNTNATDFVPITDGATLTEDRRFPALDASQHRLTYLNTNVGAWVSITNSKLLGVHAATVANASAVKRVKGQSHVSGRGLLVGVVIVLVIVPLVPWAFKRFGRK